MQQETVTNHFDYSKYEPTPNWDSKDIKELEFWGIHKTENDRILIDVKRYITTCEQMGINEFVPNALKSSSQNFLVPAKQKKHDYIFNIFNDMLNEFSDDWEHEFKPIFNKIITPNDVYEGHRLDVISRTSDLDDICGEIEVESMMSALKRQKKYEKVIQSLYCQFINKLATETDRITLIAMCRLGYKGNDYNFNSFAKFSDGLGGSENNIKIKDLDKYNAYNLLHKINNFLKHNTIASYNDLKKYYPENVASLENGTSTMPYENGMFAGDWIIIKEGYIDDLIKKLRKFFKSYCQLFVKENVDEAYWNYDEYFINAFDNLSDPWEYFGLNNL